MGKTICFYLGKPCRYGCDAAPEEQMDCKTCPAFIVWYQMSFESSKKNSKDTPDFSKQSVESNNPDIPE